MKKQHRKDKMVVAWLDANRNIGKSSYQRGEIPAYQYDKTLTPTPLHYGLIRESELNK